MYIEQKYLLLVSSQLQQFKKKGDYLYNFRCPYCGDSQKSKLKARGFIFLKENKLIYIVAIRIRIKLKLGVISLEKMQILSTNVIIVVKVQIYKIF